MKKLLTILPFYLAATTVLAQNKADIIVSYDATSPDLFGDSRTLDMTLLASPVEAMYFNNVTLWVDSLSSTPEGEARYRQMLGIPVCRLIRTALSL